MRKFLLKAKYCILNYCSVNFVLVIVLSSYYFSLLITVKELFQSKTESDVQKS